MFEKENIKPKSIVELIEVLKCKHEMFFGEHKNIYYLYYYISGYLASRIESGTQSAMDEKFQFDFNSWLYNKNSDSLKRATFWAKAIDSLYDTDEEKIEAFFRYFDEFIFDNI